jgi:hypothetical protein
MNTKLTKGEKSMRIKVTTTLRGDLWQALQIECIKRKCDANDILEELIAEHLRKSKKKGGD